MTLAAFALAAALSATPSTSPTRAFQSQADAHLKAAFDRAAAASTAAPATKPAPREGRTPRPAGR
jgi:hypothetical protein